MILTQEACWNDTTYRKHMQTNLEIYDEIHTPICQCCLVNSKRGRFSIANSLFSFFTKNDFGFSVTFMKAVSSLKNVFLKCEHGVEFQPLSNILPQTFLTSNPGPILCKSVEIVKDLGVTINYDLSWGKHVSCIVNKANKVLGVIKRSLGKDSRHAFSFLFKSLVRPILEYAAPVWSPYQKKDIESLEEVQRRASRLALKQKGGEMI